MDLIYVTPVEYSEKNIVRYFGYKIAEFDATKLQEVISGVNVKLQPKIWQEENMVCYQYPGKPLIVIEDGCLCTTLEIWNGRDFSHKEIRHQASLLLRILGQAKLASYRRRTINRRKFIPGNWRPTKK
jgi:hypothetical protein